MYCTSAVLSTDLRQQIIKCLIPLMEWHVLLFARVVYLLCIVIAVYFIEVGHA